MGKLIAGFFGLLLGSALHIGLFGLTFGLWIGHQFDEALKKSFLLWTTPNQKTSRSRALPKIYEQCFGLLGHIAKSDGLVTPEEIEVANALMSALNLRGKTKRQAAQKAFNNGKRKNFSLQSALMQIQIQCLMNPLLKQKLVEAILALRQADGATHPYKDRLIQHVLQQLNITFQYQRQQQASHGYQPTPSQSDYTLLGVDLNVTKDSLKKAYRRLMHKHHPDRLTAQGASDSEIKRATEQTQDIKAAYERICLAKGY